MSYGQESWGNERVQMELKEGDLVITLDKVEKIRAVLGGVKPGALGVVVETSANFDTMNVFGILIDGQVYYLFEDEIKKMEDQC